MVTLRSVEGNMSYGNETVSFEEETLVGSVNMGLLPGKHWNLTISLVYPNGLIANITETILFSKFPFIVYSKHVMMFVGSFHVQNGSMEVFSSYNVCFTAYFIQGSLMNGCYIEYNSTDMRHNGTIYISRTTGSEVASKCTTLNENTYDVFFYDDNKKDVAFQL